MPYKTTESRRKRQKEYRHTSPIGQLGGVLSSVRHRAKQKGLPFDLTGTYLISITPTHCPVLGIPLKRNKGGAASSNSPSIDRIVPELGYVQGNVIVVSKLANQIRSIGTPEQIIQVGEFYRKLAEKKTG